jgi:hypothetical protein
VAEVAELETTYELTPEDIVGSGGRPLIRPQTPPPPAKSEPTPVVTPEPAQPATRAPDRFAKCRKLKSKLKRKRCNRKVKLSTGSR